MCRRTVFYNSFIRVSIPISFNQFVSFMSVVPRAPIASGITLTFMFHIVVNSRAKSRQCFIFTNSLVLTLPSEGQGKSIMSQRFLSFCTAMTSGLLTYNSWSVCTMKSHSILHLSFIFSFTSPQAFIQALLSTAVFRRRSKFFTICLVHSVR